MQVGRVRGHVRVLEALDAALRPGLIVVLERVEEVGGGLLPDALRHVHLAAALVDDAHDAWVRNCALDLQRPLVQLLSKHTGTGGTSADLAWPFAKGPALSPSGARSKLYSPRHKLLLDLNASEHQDLPRH